MSQYCKHGWKGDCPMCAFEASQTTPTVMSDTKQQCPTCGSEQPFVRKQYRKGFGDWRMCRDPFHDSPVEGSGEPAERRCDKCGDVSHPNNWRYNRCPYCGEISDSPSAAGSGAREWLKKEQFPDVTIKVFAREGDGSTTVDDYRLSEILTMHADHCTAPLREERDRAMLHTKQHADREKRLIDLLEVERTRREAAERELMEAREATCIVRMQDYADLDTVAAVRKLYNLWQEAVHGAALRGKEGESNG